MKVELHILQNFAPSNLNRDDTGTPKSCEFGGYRRARVSSQCLKRAARTFVKDKKLVDEANLGIRSELHLTKLAERIGKGRDAQTAHEIVNALFGEASVKAGDRGESKVLLYFGNATIDQIAKTCEENWPMLEAYISVKREEANVSKDDSGKKKKKKDLAPELRERLNAAEENFGKIAGEVNGLLNIRATADIAMFGRMIADAPKLNQDAASQVSHAISTNAVTDVEIDYFTALDELKDKDEPGAAHINTTEFNSACYYRYANMDVEELKKNLKDAEGTLPRKTLEAFLQAFVLAVPSGKQNSFATPTTPSLVLAVVREHSLCSLANAFERPINHREREDAGIMGSSIRRLAEHFDKLEGLYGDFIGKQAAFVLTDASEYLDYSVKKAGKEERTRIKAEEVASLKALIDRVVQNAFHDDGQKGADEQ